MLTVKMTGPNGLTPELMSQILEIRQRELNQTAEQAVKATAIGILKSLRARTRQAKQGKTRAEILDTGFYGGWSNEKNRPVARSGVSPYSSEVAFDNLKVAPNTYVKGVSQKDRHIYQIVNEKGKRYYLIARDAGVAEKYETLKRNGRIKRLGGLAKRALTFGMVKIAAKPQEGRTTADIEKVVNRLAVEVRMQYSGKVFSLDFEDKLNYCIGALQGGRSDVDTSIKSALNSTIGYINKKVARNANIFTKKYEIPFPELAK